MCTCTSNCEHGGRRGGSGTSATQREGDVASTEGATRVGGVSRGAIEGRDAYLVLVRLPSRHRAEHSAQHHGVARRGTRSSEFASRRARRAPADRIDDARARLPPAPPARRVRTRASERGRVVDRARSPGDVPHAALRGSNTPPDSDASTETPANPRALKFLGSGGPASSPRDRSRHHRQTVADFCEFG